MHPHFFQMKNFIKGQLRELSERLSEIPSELRTFRLHPWRVAVAVALLALMVYAIYFAPVVFDLGYWVRYGSFPRR
jgi:hypothetical protein